MPEEGPAEGGAGGMKVAGTDAAGALIVEGAAVERLVSTEAVIDAVARRVFRAG